MSNYERVSSKEAGRKNRYLYEYMYHQVIQDINDRRKKNNEPVIVVSKARRLREDVLAKLAESGFDFTDTNVGTFKTAINEVLTTENNGVGPFVGEEGSKAYARYFNTCIRDTGWQPKNGSIPKPETPLIPMSPYDDRIANKETVMQNGSAMLYIKADTVDLASGKSKTSDIVFYKQDRRGNLQDVGDFTTKGDRSGMARLLRFIPEKDYQALADWVNSAPEDQYMSKSAVDRSVAVLSYLQDNGYAFEISKDRNPGQLKASINGTRTNVRITDTKDNDTYVGSIYDDGRRVYFATTPSQRRPKFVVTPEDSVNLLKFTLGESVERQDIQGTVGAFGVYRSGQYVKPNSYHVDKGGYSAVYKGLKDEYGRDSFDKVTIHFDNKRANLGVNFADSESAETYLQSAVRDARENYASQMEVDRLVQEAKEHAGEEDYVPMFSGNDAIAAVQQSYWDILSGRQSELLQVGITKEEYQEMMTASKEYGALTNFFTKDMWYEGTPEEKVRAHLSDMVDDVIGQYELDEDGKRFDPAGVSSYMTSGYGTYRNNDNLISAMRQIQFNADELKGDDFNTAYIKNRLIRFNPENAKPMGQIGHPFVQTMYDSIRKTLAETGCDVKDKDILFDENGIVHYTGTRTRNWKKPVQETISGEIGQIFVPDELGMVKTKFAGTENYMFVPGYNATVIPQKDGENLSLEERTRLRGYEQELKRAISYQIRSDLMSDGSNFGEPTSVNRVCRSLYDTRYPLDVVERSRTDGMRKDVFEAVVKTLGRRVRYSNDFKDNSTINADFQANRDNGFNDIANDNYYDAYRLSGRKNMSLMTEDSAGYFDLQATSTSTNQGIVRYLTESAQVDSEGRIMKGREDDKTPLMKIDEMKYMDYSPFDRNQMVFSNLLTARAVANDVKMAQMTFGGWTFDDGYVVSKEFAEKHQIRGADGTLRPMIKGDKICDFGGNKGVISLVVDRDLSSDKIFEELTLDYNSIHRTGSQVVDAQTGKRSTKYMNQATCHYRGQDYKVNLDSNLEDTIEMQAAKQIQKKLGYEGCDEAIRWFQANPELDVVGAPFPAVSRFNASSDRLLMEHPSDLKSPDGKVFEGCMGTTSFIITDMPVDEKTHNYGEEELSEGKGRKASSQLAWALASQDATEVLSEFYSTNSGAVSNLREVLITMGLDMSETGELRDHYEPHVGEQRRVFEMPELQYRVSGEKKYLNITKMRQEFGQMIQDAGGIMEVPFPLEYPTGKQLPPMNDGKTDVVYTAQEWTRKGYTRKDGVYVKPTTVHRHVDASTQRTASAETYGLPILSSHLRSGQEFGDGTVAAHDYTNQYQAIYEASCRYRDELSKPNCDETLLKQYQSDAQRSFNQVTMDLRQRKFDNQKHNIFKDDLMSNRLAKSATTVWTADPRLDIDQVAVGLETAKTLNVKDNDYIVTWRDPMLRDEGLKYSRVKIDPTLSGVAINPACDKPYDGDFDGDSNGNAKLQSRAAHKEAMQKLTWDANLLDKGALGKDENGKDFYSLQIQSGLDLASAYYARPELKAERADLERRINRFESQKAFMSAEELQKHRRQAVRDLSAHVKDAFANEFGTDMISYKDPEHHLKSIENFVKSGAKGSYSKLQDYMKYMGWSAEMVKDSSGKVCGIDYSTLKDNGKSFATHEDAVGVMYATAVKAFGTGVAGKYSQRGISALRDVCPTAVLEETYPNTQGVLQAKHDPVDAANRYQMLMTTARDLWRGYKLDKENTGSGYIWEVARDKFKRPIQATPDEFKQQFLDVYGKDGLDSAVNEHYVEDIARALTNPNTGCIMNMEEESIPGSSVMDKLTYGGGFDAVVEAAEAHEDLFAGKYTQYFAPANIRRNRAAALEQSLGSEHAKDLKAIVKTDTKEGVKTKPVSNKAISVGGARRMPNVPESVMDSTPVCSDDFGD